MFSITIIMQVNAIVAASFAHGNKKRAIQNGTITSSNKTGAKERFMAAIKFTIVELSLLECGLSI